MIERKKQWESLVDKACRASAPQLDVSAQVARRIAGASTHCNSVWPSWSAAGLSAAAALMMVVATTLSGVSWEDPLGDWFSSLFLMM